MTDKLSSRKFLVWLVWGIITLINLVADVIIIIATKNITSEMISLTSQVLGWFFAISMMYLGMNVGQKVGLSFSDILKNNKEQ